MTLNDLLGKAREISGGNALPGDLANYVLDEALGRPDAYELLIPAVYAWVRTAERERVAEHERDVFAGPIPPRNPARERPAAPGFSGPMIARNPGTLRPLNPAEEAMKRLLADTCEVPGHGRVPWGAMTAELHRLRIDLLGRLRDRYVAGTNATIRRHSFAIGLLEESGCADLNAYVAEYGELPDDLAGTPQDTKIPA